MWALRWPARGVSGPGPGHRHRHHERPGQSPAGGGAAQECNQGKLWHDADCRHTATSQLSPQILLFSRLKKGVCSDEGSAARQLLRLNFVELRSFWSDFVRLDGFKESPRAVAKDAIGDTISLPFWTRIYDWRNNLENKSCARSQIHKTVSCCDTTVVPLPALAWV